MSWYGAELGINDELLKSSSSESWNERKKDVMSASVSKHMNW